jgi:hypothetical protein
VYEPLGHVYELFAILHQNIGKIHRPPIAPHSGVNTTHSRVPTAHRQTRYSDRPAKEAYEKRKSSHWRFIGSALKCIDPGVY